MSSIAEADPVLQFLHTHTTVRSPELCPEIRLHLSSDLESTWASLEASSLPRTGSPPFWSIAWIGGQALARYTLDDPVHCRDRSVLDLGSGSGLCAIAAAKAGASRVEAADTDPIASAVIPLNAKLNNVEVHMTGKDVIEADSRWDVILAGDIWYERFVSQRLTAWLRTRAYDGTTVLLGDCGRAYFPSTGVTELCCYAVQTSERIERRSISRVSAWML